MSGLIEHDAPFLGLAFNPWDDGVRSVYRVHEINEARTHVLVSYIGKQHGPNLIRLPGVTPRVGMWRPVAGFGSVFVGTDTLVKGGTWARKIPRVRLDTLALLTDRQLLGLDPTAWDTVRATVPMPVTTQA
jgi:hypothetical protein